MPELTLELPPRMTGALCKGDDTNTWFPEPPHTPNKAERARYEADVAFAKEICSMCQVRAECLSGALERGEIDGVWGGENFYVSSHHIRATLRPRTLEDLRQAS